MGSLYIGQPPFHSLDKVTFFKDIKYYKGYVQARWGYLLVMKCTLP